MLSERTKGTKHVEHVHHVSSLVEQPLCLSMPQSKVSTSKKTPVQPRMEHYSLFRTEPSSIYRLRQIIFNEKRLNMAKYSHFYSTDSLTAL